VRKAESDAEWKNPNVVKAVLDRMNYALYFSRAPIPWHAGPDAIRHAPHWIHIGIYGFRRPFLFRFAALSQTTLEREERLEQLRVLEHGCAIKAVVVSEVTCGVDRPGDVKKVERILAKGHMRERSL
jgi:3-deoxy-manno-octulosonate cytidylyltransferase (CMP-KDO synthetase)